MRATGQGASGPIILFDANCVLCSANARFIRVHDRRGVFRLASMQTGAGAALCRAHGMDPADLLSLLMVEDGVVRTDSDAVLAIYERLGFAWRLVTLARLVPRRWRDRAYRWIARNRYRLFGRRATCWVAPPEFRERVL